jgi:hypothetical protein
VKRLILLLVLAAGCQGTPPEPGPSEPAVQSTSAALSEAEAEPAAQPVAAPASAPASCDAAKRLLHVQPFTLAKAHPYHWMKGHAPLTGGKLVVVEVEPACARPREMAMPVLYAGGVPVEVANAGFPSGHLVVIVPAEVDLATQPIFYGGADLPERIDAAQGASELAAAQARGVAPFSPAALAAASQPGALALADTDALYRAVADLIDRFAPDEADRARSYRGK